MLHGRARFIGPRKTVHAGPAFLQTTLFGVDWFPRNTALAIRLGCNGLDYSGDVQPRQAALWFRTPLTNGDCVICNDIYDSNM